MARKPTAAQLAELEGTTPQRGPTPEQLAELDAPQGPGPLRDNPTFSTTPPATPDPGVPRLPPIGDLPAQHTPFETFGRNVVQGMTGGFADEIGAILGTAAEKGWVPSSSVTEFGGVDLPDGPTTPQADPNEPAVDKYRRLRDADRALDAEMNAANPKAAVAGGVAGAIVSPLSKLTGPGPAARIAGGAGQGAVNAAGASEADATRGEIVPLLKDSGKGALVGGSIAAMGEAGKKVIQKGKQLFSLPEDELRTRVLNEVAESGKSATTPTARKHLEVAGNQIAKEIVQGPEGEAIRAAIGSGAKKGAKKVTEVADRLTSENNAAYAAFDAAGKSAVDVTLYRVGLQNVANGIRGKGKSQVADAIEKFGDHVLAEGKKTGGLTLKQLRGLTTQAQTIAASAIGGLNEHQAAALGKAVVRQITPAMKDVLKGLAGDDAGLKKATETILANNQRLTGLLAMSRSLKQQVYKESTGAPPLVQAAKAAALPAAVGATTGALGSEDKVEGAFKGALIGGSLRYGIPAAARAASRARTGLAIDVARTVPPPPGGARQVAAEFAGALGRIGGTRVAKKREEEEAR